MNPLIELKDFGQSVWYDNIRRSLITSGEFERMIREYAVTGVTSNPTIFEKAISGGAEYDDDIKRFVAEGLDEADILKNLFIEDIRLAAASLRPVHNGTDGEDGYVSIEVRPSLAHDALSTMEEARNLASLVDMPNLMVKVPATFEGLEAIEELVYEGYNINVTLLFSVDRYAHVAEAYVRGVERRVEEEKSVSDIFSVASFFVSRVDTLIDGIIEERLEAAASSEEKKVLEGLPGKSAVWNAKLAYLKYGEIFGGERFARLARHGARPQKLLWASTSTKNPAYRDVKYVEELIAEGTINTMPLQTLLAFHDHGRVSSTLVEGLDEAREMTGRLSDAGIDYSSITLTLEDKGVKAFVDSYEDLLKCVAAKKEMFLMGAGSGAEFHIRGFEDRVSSAVKRLEDERFAERILEKDATLWKDSPREREQIRNSLGWIALPFEMEAATEELKGFADEVRKEGLKRVVVLGMGGSSLAPLVVADTFGPQEGWPELKILDSTDPGAVKAVEEEGGLEKTLFVVASKSGTTIEPMSFFEYFYDKLKRIKGDAAGENFISITDPGSPLEGLSKERGFRHTFLNPPDVGGRFSALSYFALVPAALAGIDVSRLLYYAARTEVAEEPCVAAKKQPGIMLGVVLAELAKAGRDKMTVSLSEGIESFGLWIEQLVAESTGKEGKGIVPVTGEPLGSPGDYSPDRVFVHIGLETFEGEAEGRLKDLVSAGHPVIRIRISDPHELGGEFLRWEFATAVAGHILGINPFDQPDVEVAKELARKLLEKKEAPGPPGAGFEAKGFKAFFGKSAMERMKGDLEGRDPAALIRAFLALVGEGDYIALLAYFNTFDGPVEGALRGVQKTLMTTTKSAVQFGFGPRYLHSTGQLHKGGGDNGVFIILTHEPHADVEVPGKGFGFSRLELSQAFGDMEALDSRGRRVVLLSLKEPTAGAIEEIHSLVREQLAENSRKFLKGV